MESRPGSAPRRRPDRIDRELREITAGSSRDARFTEPPAALRGRQAVERSASLAANPGRWMAAGLTELTWRARLAAARRSRVLARAAALAVLLGASGGLARLSWLVAEQSASPPASSGIIRTADSQVSPHPGAFPGLPPGPVPAAARIPPGLALFPGAGRPRNPKGGRRWPPAPAVPVHPAGTTAGTRTVPDDQGRTGATRGR
jgi:hypothetical protein